MCLIEQFSAREILDSRGRPTVEATCLVQGGVTASASVPSGASTGKAEAVELRDRDPARYGGLGCKSAAANISGPIHEATRGKRFTTQAEFDQVLISLDGTTNKSRLGANAVLASSIAFARAAALARRIPLWQYFAELIPCVPSTLPRLTINLFSGGKHGGHQVAIQDVLIVPLATETIDESLSVAWNVYQAAAKLVFDRYGLRLLRADEGGQAPPCRTAEEMVELAIDAVESAGYRSGSDIVLALDVASTHFYVNGRYVLDGQKLSSEEMIARIEGWLNKYPVRSVEDGLSEDDWVSWSKLFQRIGDRALVVGDDLLCTNAERIRRAILERSCNALLLKVNQVGTLTEAAEAYRLARSAGWAVTLSVRSGETEDHWAADLAVGWGADQFKNGSITQSERLAKYNRLLRIEEYSKLPLANWPANVRR